MSKSVFAAGYRLLLKELIAARISAGLTQQQVAKRLRRPQSFVSKYESGERRLDVVEFLVLAGIVGADPHAIMRKVARVLD